MFYVPEIFILTFFVVCKSKSHSPEGTRLVRIDGPFGAASEEVFDFKVLMMIGAGIGVTPFASILKALLHRKRTSSQCKVEKVHFYWICREYKAFEWFQTLLRGMKKENMCHCKFFFLIVS